jgi:hypothetical protein
MNWHHYQQRRHVHQYGHANAGHAYTATSIIHIIAFIIMVCQCAIFVSASCSDGIRNGGMYSSNLLLNNYLGLLMMQHDRSLGCGNR